MDYQFLYEKLKFAVVNEHLGIDIRDLSVVLKKIQQWEIAAMSSKTGELEFEFDMEPNIREKDIHYIYIIHDDPAHSLKAGDVLRRVQQGSGRVHYEQCNPEDGFKYYPDGVKDGAYFYPTLQKNWIKSFSSVKNIQAYINQKKAVKAELIKAGSAPRAKLTLEGRVKILEEIVRENSEIINLFSKNLKSSKGALIDKLVDVLDLEIDEEDEHAAFSDFTKIKGIGPAVQKFLYNQGISTYVELQEKTTPELIEIISKRFSSFNVGCIKHWGMQAKLAEEGSWETLIKFQKTI